MPVLGFFGGVSNNNSYNSSFSVILSLLQLHHVISDITIDFTLVLAPKDLFD